MNKNLKKISAELKKINNMFRLNQFKLVINDSQNLILKYPKIIPFYNFLGLSYERTYYLEKAKNVYLKALIIEPNNLSVLSNLGNVLRKLKNFSQSEKILLKAIKLNSEYIFALINYADLKVDQSNTNEAIKFYKKVYNLDNKFFDISFRLARSYLDIGEFDLAKNYAEITLNNFPTRFDVDLFLSNLNDYSQDDNHQKVMLNKLNDTKFKKIDKIPLYFALAKSFNDQKNYNDSFRYFILGNKGINSKIKNKDYILKREIEFENKLKKIIKKYKFDKTLLEKSSKKKLIFILGLPRSGTSLVHQILASHSKTFGAGELTIVNSFFEKNFMSDNFLSKIFKNDKINLDYIAELSLYFLSDYEKLDKTKIIIDKNPFNFFWIGFIKLMFPNSKIIITDRNIKDTCLSIYKNNFEAGLMLWSYDQDDIIKFVKIYKNLTSSWKKILLKDIYEINYERLVKNQETESKKLLKFCSLDWEENCLRFDKVPKPIKTASLFQTRKKIYNSSLNISSKYSNYLDFFNKLEKL